MILLDTCALLWLDSDRSKFTKSTLSLLNSNYDSLAVSTISFTEIGIKHQRKKLTLPTALKDWTDEICQQYSLTVIPVSKAIAVEAPSLPVIHKDPFDRIIIATAIINKLKVITADTVFSQYPGIKSLI